MVKKTVSTVTVTVVTEKQFQLGTVSEKQLRLTLQLGTVSEKQIRFTFQVVTGTEKQIRVTFQLGTGTEKQLQNRYGRYNSYSRNDPPWSLLDNKHIFLKQYLSGEVLSSVRSI